MKQRTMSPSGLDPFGAATAWSALASDMFEAYGNFVDAAASDLAGWTRPGWAYAGGRAHASACRCGCRAIPCREDDCHCACCVHDADLVVTTRLYERRVVPVRLANDRARARQISLHLGDFATNAGHAVPVRGRILTDTSFELDSCATAEVILLVETGQGQEADLKEFRESGRFDDVDDCVVGRADLVIDGCGVRPVRIAVAVVPRDCDAHDVACDCGCC